MSFIFQILNSNFDKKELSMHNRLEAESIDPIELNIACLKFVFSGAGAEWSNEQATNSRAFDWFLYEYMYVWDVMRLRVS